MKRSTNPIASKTLTRWMTRLAAASLLLVGCAAPKIPGISFKIPQVHRITVQQGNVITAEMVGRLKQGMTKEQVTFIMGESIAHNIFNPNRWDYIYTIEVPGRFKDEKRTTVYFEDGALSRLTGDFAPSSAPSQDDEDSADSAEG